MLQGQEGLPVICGAQLHAGLAVFVEAGQFILKDQGAFADDTHIGCHLVNFREEMAGYKDGHAVT